MMSEEKENNKIITKRNKTFKKQQQLDEKTNTTFRCLNKLIKNLSLLLIIIIIHLKNMIVSMLLLKIYKLIRYNNIFM